MDVIGKLETDYGVRLPQGYREWSLKKYTDYRDNTDGYLWVHEAEWIPPDQIPQRDLWRKDIIPGLIPFAFSGAGDNWCWNTQVRNDDSEYDILYCWHDEELADLYAPTFPAWFYRTCLDYASNAIDDDPDEIEEGRENLRLWSERLSEIHPGSWSNHLSLLADTKPTEYNHPNPSTSATVFGFISPTDVHEIVANQFGERFIGKKVEWGARD